MTDITNMQTNIETHSLHVVVTLGYWGKGTTLQEAAKACFKAGSGRREKAVVYRYDGPPDDLKQVAVDSHGSIEYPQTCESTQIYGLRPGMPRVTLGHLMR